MRDTTHLEPSEGVGEWGWFGSGARLGLLFFLLTMCGCGAPFTINPKAAVPPAADTLPTNRVGSLSIAAEQVDDENFLYEAFDSNPIMAGILPVWVRVTNNGESSVDLKKLDCSLAGPNGATYKRLDPHKVYSRLMSFYQIKAYTISSYKQSRNDFDSTALGLDPVPPGGSHGGYLFFSVPPDSARGGGLKLIMRNIGQPPGHGDGSIQINL